MNSVTQRMFGYGIAFVSPGLVLLWGVSNWLGEIPAWLGIRANAETTFAEFLLIVLVAMSLGVFVSGVRWAVIDTLLDQFTRTRRPNFDLHSLTDPNILTSYNQMTESFYRYYQFYANVLVAMWGSYAMWLWRLSLNPLERPAGLLVVAAASSSLLLSAKDALSRYYEHLIEILGVSDW